MGKRKILVSKTPQQSNYLENYKNESKLQNDIENQKFKGRRAITARISGFEKLLQEWLWTIYHENICVTDKLFLEKAKRFLDNLSNSWFYKLKPRK